MYLSYSQWLHLNSYCFLGLVVEANNDVCLFKFELRFRLLHSHSDVPLVDSAVFVEVYSSWFNCWRSEHVLGLVTNWLDCRILICVLWHNIGIVVVDEEELCIEFVVEDHLRVLLSDSRPRPEVCRIMSFSHALTNLITYNRWKRCSGRERRWQEKWSLSKRRTQSCMSSSERSDNSTLYV